MSTSHSLSHFSNAISPFPYNLTKIPTPLITFGPPKFNFIAFSSSPTNGSNSTKVEGRSIEHERLDHHVKSSEPIPHSGSAIKAPTAPWMTRPLLVKSNEIMEFRKPRTNRDCTFGENRIHPDIDLTGKVGGGRGKVAMKKIFKGIKKLQGTQNLEETITSPENLKFKFAPGALWGDGDYENGAEVEENSEEAQESLESNGFDIPLGEVEKEVRLKKMPWERDDRMVIGRVKKEKVATVAELRLDDMLLERLGGEAARIRKWVKVKKAGVTQAVVDQVHFVWRNNELALLKFDLPLCRNMQRALEIVEVRDLYTFHQHCHLNFFPRMCNIMHPYLLC